MGEIDQKIMVLIHNKNHDLDIEILTEVLKEINSEYTKHKKEGVAHIDFHSLWGAALVHAKVSDLFHNARYIGAIASYYSYRNKKKFLQKKLDILSRDMKVTKVSSTAARVEITSTSALIFCTYTTRGKLTKRNLGCDSSSTKEQKMPKVTKGTITRARNMAMKEINVLRNRLKLI